MAKQIENGQSPFQRAVMEGLVASKKATTSKKGPKPDNGVDWRQVFIGGLYEGRTIAAACKRAGVVQSTIYRRRVDDPEFRRAWNEAAEIGTRLLEQEAQRRAYHGVLKPVYQQGVCVGYERKYSDTLMAILLKARRPEKYREGIENSKRGDTIVNIVIEDKKEEPKVVVAEPSAVESIEVVTVEKQNDSSMPCVR